MPAFDSVLPPQTYARWNPKHRAGYHPFLPMRATLSLVARWIERSRQRDALAGLEDRMLRDIGISRVDAARECEKPFWR